MASMISDECPKRVVGSTHKKHFSTSALEKTNFQKLKISGAITRTLMPTCKIRKLSLATATSLLTSALLYSPMISAGETEYRVIPYLWTAGMDVEIGKPGMTTDGDVYFDDYIDFIDTGAAFIFNAVGEKWSFIAHKILTRFAFSVERATSIWKPRSTSLMAPSLTRGKVDGIPSSVWSGDPARTNGNIISRAISVAVSRPISRGR